MKWLDWTEWSKGGRVSATGQAAYCCSFSSALHYLYHEKRWCVCGRRATNTQQLDWRWWWVTTGRGRGQGEENRWLDGQMDEWMDRLTGVWKRFAMATLAEPIICQGESECIGEGNMDANWAAVLAASLLLSTAEPQNMTKCACCQSLPVCVCARISVFQRTGSSQRGKSDT